MPAGWMDRLDVCGPRRPYLCRRVVARTSCAGGLAGSCKCSRQRWEDSCNDVGAFCAVGLGRNDRADVGNLLWTCVGGGSVAEAWRTGGLKERGNATFGFFSCLFNANAPLSGMLCDVQAGETVLMIATSQGLLSMVDILSRHKEQVH